MTYPGRQLVCLLVLASTLPRAAIAAPDIDLSRTVPVEGDAIIPITDFFRAPLFQSPKLNSNGTRFVALVETGTDHTGLMVYDLEKRRAQSAAGIGDMDVYSVAWLSPEKLLLSLSKEKLYAAGLFVANAVKLGEGYAVETNNATSLVGVPRKSPMKPLIWIRQNAYDDGNDLGVVQIDATRDLNRNRESLRGSRQEEDRKRDSDYGTRAAIVSSYSRPPGVGVDYIADKEGELAFAITARDGRYALYRYQKNRWELCPVDLDEVFPVAPGEKPDELIVVGPRQEGMPRGVHRLDAVTGELGDLLYRDNNYDVDACSFYTHPANGAILGVSFSRSRKQTIWFDQGYESLQKILDGLFPGNVVQLMGSNDDETRFFLAVYSDRQPVVYYSFDLATKKVELVQGTAPWIDPARMRPMNILKVTTRDGLALEAYLTLPEGASKTNPAPLVVLPHGGPWVRDTWRFDAEVQFLASRGYAVLQPNYRGSPGYNWKFPQSDQWAFRKMHDDVTDSVRTLMKTRLIDPDRVAIMGTSFGAYLAACGAAFEPDLYRCAIAIAGIYDWATVLKEARSQRFESAEFGVLLRNLGDPEAKQEEFSAISPLRHVSKMNIPFLVAHGKSDSIAAVAESRALVEQFEKFGVPHESLLVRGEGHGMTRLKNQIELYTRVERFLEKHLAPKAGVVAAASP